MEARGRGSVRKERKMPGRRNPPRGSVAWAGLLAALAVQFAAATGAGAEPGPLATATGSARTASAGILAEVSVRGDDPAGGKEAGAASKGTVAVTCLQEGEACNPLNDLCCPGYYCPGGLARTCAPKP